jgi:hypothetical protein
VALQRWLLDDVLRAVPQTDGLGSAHLLQGAQPAAMTNEQRLRGADRGMACAVIVTGYDGDAVAAFAQRLGGADGLAARGAGDTSSAIYRWSYSVSSAEPGG